jgi:mRNA interferase HigB
MPMRVISEKTLRDFWANHPNVRQPLQAWLEDAKRADWNSPADIKAIYKNVSVIANDRVIFNIIEVTQLQPHPPAPSPVVLGEGERQLRNFYIKGNGYRLVAKIHYNGKRIYIGFIGTHAEYDKIDAEII